MVDVTKKARYEECNMQDDDAPYKNDADKWCKHTRLRRQIYQLGLEQTVHIHTTRKRSRSLQFSSSPDVVSYLWKFLVREGFVKEL